MLPEAVRLTQKLVRIDSQNPPGNEGEMVEFIKNYLNNLGISVAVHEFKKGRPNLIAKIKPLRKKKSLLFTPHLDTVPASGKWRFPPFSGRIHKGKIYGRGATDCKCNIAVLLAAIKKLKKQERKLKNLEIVLVFTADEETGSQWGIKPLARYLRRIDYGVVLDADEFDVIVAQKGLLHLRVEVFGKEAHGAYPDRGINAIEKVVRILSDIVEKEIPYSAHPLLKRPTLNIGRIGGGEKVNIVAGEAFFELDIRFLPGMKVTQLVSYIERIVRRYVKRYRITILAQQEPAEVNMRSLGLRVLCKTLRKQKIKPVLKPSFGATVINFLQEKGIDTFAFGFGSRGCAHVKDEYVTVKNLVKGTEVLFDYICAMDEVLERGNPREGKGKG